MIHRQLIETPNNIRIRWVPGHSQIDGNEVADKQANRAAMSEITPSEHITDTCEVKSIILAKVTQYWRKRWTEYKGRNHLSFIICYTGCPKNKALFKKNGNTIFSIKTWQM